MSEGRRWGRVSTRERAAWLCQADVVPPGCGGLRQADVVPPGDFESRVFF